MARIIYKTLNITMADNTSSKEEAIDIPYGNIIAIGAVIAGDTDDKIINCGLFNNGSEELTPSDIRFFEKTNGGHWLHSLRPLDIKGGRRIEAKLSASANITAGAVTVQLLFVVDTQPEI